MCTYEISFPLLNWRLSPQGVCTAPRGPMWGKTCKRKSVKFWLTARVRTVSWAARKEWKVKQSPSLVQVQHCPSEPSFPLFGWNEPISDCSSQPHSSPYLLLPIRKAWGIPPLKDLPAHTLFALFQHSFEYSLATISKPVPVLDTEAENTSKSWLYLQGTQWHGRSSGPGSLFLNCG